MDKKLKITLLFEFMVGFVVTILVSLGIKEFPWTVSYPVSLSAVPVIVTIFVMALTTIVSCIGSLIRNEGDRLVNVSVLIIVLLMSFFIFQFFFL